MNKSPNSATVKSWIGLFLAFISGIVNASMSLVAKYLENYNPFTVELYCFLGVFLATLPFLAFNYIKERKENESNILQTIWPPTQKQQIKALIALLFIAVSGLGAVTFQIFAIQYISIGDDSVIGSCSSVFVMFVAHIWLREECRLFPVFSALLTIVGVAIIARPPFLTGATTYNSAILIGTSYSFVRMISTSIKTVIIRYLVHVETSLLVAMTGLIQFVICLIVAVSMGVLELPSNCKDTILLAALGIIYFSYHMTSTAGLKRLDAGIFTVVRMSSNTLAAFVMQYLFLSSLLDLYSAIGGLIMLATLLMTAINNWVKKLEEENIWRKRMCCVLL